MRRVKSLSPEILRITPLSTEIYLRDPTRGVPFYSSVNSVRKISCARLPVTWAYFHDSEEAHLGRAVNNYSVINWSVTRDSLLLLDRDLAAEGARAQRSSAGVGASRERLAGGDRHRRMGIGLEL